MNTQRHYTTKRREFAENTNNLASTLDYNLLKQAISWVCSIDENKNNIHSFIFENVAKSQNFDVLLDARDFVATTGTANFWQYFQYNVLEITEVSYRYFW